MCEEELRPSPPIAGQCPAYRHYHDVACARGHLNSLGLPEHAKAFELILATDHVPSGARGSRERHCDKGTENL
eukprot:3545007-Amphidinium_carterae.1